MSRMESGGRFQVPAVNRNIIGVMVGNVRLPQADMKAAHPSKPAMPN
jgi:hypothetical protein